MSNIKAIAPLRTGGNLAAIIPQSFEDVQRIAAMAVAAGLGSRDYRDTPEQAIAKAAAAIMHGLEVGVKPLQALNGIAIINGKPTMYGDLLTAVLWANGFKIKKWVDGAGDARVAHTQITRPDGEMIEATFSVAQAKQARLWDTRETVRKKNKTGDYYEAANDSAWHRFPEDMLGWKSTGRAVRAGASDVTHGMAIREDMDNPIVDITPDPAPAIPSIDDIPEITDPAKEPVANSSQDVDNQRKQPDTEADNDPIADEGGFLRKLKGDLDGERDEAIRLEIWESNADIIARLSDAAQRTAERIFEGRA